MDNIAEQLVEKRRTGADLAKKILISAGALIIASFFMYIAMMGFFVMVIRAVLVLAASGCSAILTLNTSIFSQITIST